ncbi:hypothetical protein KM043_004338 [Ampulex compressa]|nr:hypothetical protein KM043_004338 [Ampulex compressa]
MDNEQNILVNDYTEIVQRLPLSLRLAYGVGHVLNDICASMWFTYLLVYFHLVLGFDPTLAGVILLIGQVADALATPFVGFHSDKTDDFWLCKYGARKTWHLLGTICVLFAFPFIFSQCVGCENAHHSAQLVYYAAFVVIFQFGWAAVQISHLSLVPELTPTEHERTELIAIRYSFTVFSNILIYCITWAVLHITSDQDADAQIGPGDAHKFQKIVFIGIGTGFVTSFIFHVFVKEGAVNNPSGSVRRNGRSTISMLKDVQLYQVACIYMPTRLFVNLSQIYIPLYLHESLSMPATSLATIPLTMFLSSFVMSLIIEKLNTKLGRKVAYSIGVLLGLSACIWIRFGSGNAYVKYEIYPVSLLLGCAGSIMLVTSLGVSADLIGQNTQSGAFVYGVMSFTDKLSNGLIVMLIQYLRCTITCTNYYRDIIAYACGASAVFGLLMILYIKPFSHNSNYDTLYAEQPVEQDNSSVSATTPEIERISREDYIGIFSNKCNVLFKLSVGYVHVLSKQPHFDVFAEYCENQRARFQPSFGFFDISWPRMEHRCAFRSPPNNKVGECSYVMVRHPSLPRANEAAARDPPPGSDYFTTQASIRFSSVVAPRRPPHRQRVRAEPSVLRDPVIDWQASLYESVVSFKP